MTPEIVQVNGKDYRIFNDGNGVYFPAAPIETFALRRAFFLEVGQSKLITFDDLTGFWNIKSLYISSPEISEINIEILDANNYSFFTDKLTRGQTPKSLPSVLITPELKMRLTANRENINVVLIYLKPADLAYSRDF